MSREWAIHLLEAGFMAGQGKPVLTLALEPVEPDLMNLLLGPTANICCTLNDLFDRLDHLVAAGSDGGQ